MSALPRTSISVIPHSTQRYETVGDYWHPSEHRTEIRVSATGNSDYDFLIAVHEFVEQYLCQRRGIQEPDIKAFDEQFEHERELGIRGLLDEPGHDPKAPYNKEHIFAEKIERQIAEELGVDWEEYSRVVESL
jgi:hypothetical protein